MAEVLELLESENKQRNLGENLCSDGTSKHFEEHIIAWSLEGTRGRSQVRSKKKGFKTVDSMRANGHTTSALWSSGSPSTAGVDRRYVLRTGHGAEALKL